MTLAKMGLSSSMKLLLFPSHGHRGHKSSSLSTSSSAAASGTKNSTKSQNNDHDEMFIRLRREAAEVAKREPILCMLLTKVGLLDATTLPNNSPYQNAILATAIEPPATSFEEIIARIVSHRLSSCSGGTENICPKFLLHLLLESFRSDELELGHTMSEAVREDAKAVYRRDPAVETLLEAVLFLKGFHSLVIHRAARRAWKPASVSAVENIEESENGTMNGNGNDVEHAKTDIDDSSNHNGISVSGKRFVALLLQSQASSAFGVDIHPAASIGAGVMIDHASGVVIGETATVGDGTTILHGVTLGGTGKDHGDRHPKIGRDVLIGAGTKILGNITVGDRAKIGAGSVVLRPIPSGATAVGSPAKIIGFIPRGERPGSSVDMKLENVEALLGKKKSDLSSSLTEGTTTSSDSFASTDEAITSTVTASNKLMAQEKKKKKVGFEPDVGDTEESTSNEEEEADHQNKEAPEEEGEASDECEGDDDITDFGTAPKCRWVKITNHNNDGLCPFRGSFRDISTSIKQQTISHTELRALLIQEGCSEGECVEVFFELLHCTPSSSKARSCGCIPLDIFAKCFPEIAKEKTKLDMVTIQALAKGDLRTLGMSKKASRRFKSVFTNLGRQVTAPVLGMIPSSGSLLDSSLRKSELPGSGCLPKSERDKMATHLDTTGYAEGITI